MSKPGPNRLSVENGTNLEAIARARYFAFAQRRTMPPRCNPYGILGITLSLGILFLGLTMTIIANWPGVTSISGNQLFVAGPILLGVGGIAFIVVIIVVFVLSQRQQALWETRVTNMALERTSSLSKEPLVKDNNGSNVAAGPYYGRTSDGYDPYGRNSGISEPYARSSSVFDPAARSSNVPKFPIGIPQVQPLPNPGKSTDMSVSFHDSSFDSNQGQVPAPMRVQKKRRGKRSENSSSGSVNHSYSLEVGEADLGIPGVYSPPKKATTPVRDSGHPGYSNEVYESSKITTITTTTTNIIAINSGKLGPQPQGKPGGKVDSEKQRRGDVDPIRGAITRGASQDLSQQALRVHIRAQPGTAVHITPSSTPPRGGHPSRMSVESNETEI